MKQIVFFILFTFASFGFTHKAEIVEPTNRSLLLMSPREFFNQDIAHESINLYNPNNNLLSVSIFQATNLLREKKGLQKFKPDYTLHMAGLSHIESMMENNFFGHEDPYNSNQREFRQRIENNGGDFYIVAENLALVHPYNTPGVEYKYRYINNQYFYYDMKDEPLVVMTYAQMGKSIVRDWYDSKGHRENLLAPELTHLGIAVIVEDNVFKEATLPDVYAVQNFGAYYIE